MAEKTAIEWCAANADFGRSGPLNPHWKGGRSIASNGYVLIRVGRDHHLSDVRGYAYEHRLVAEMKIGRRLLKGEIVHHIDGDKQNNADENIEIKPSRAHHALEHRVRRTDLRTPEQPNPTVTCECGCGASFQQFDYDGRPRRFVSGHNLRRG